MRLNNHLERVRFLRFATVGCIGAIVDFGLFNLLISLFRLHATWSSVISFIAAVISNFIWNRLWTYPDSRSKVITYQLAQFGLVSVIGLGIRTSLFNWELPLMENLINNSTIHLPVSATVVGQNLALGTAVVIVMLWNFIVNRYWTYSDIS